MFCVSHTNLLAVRGGFSVLSESVSRTFCYKLQACLCATVIAPFLLHSFWNSYGFAALHREKPGCVVGKHDSPMDTHQAASVC